MTDSDDDASVVRSPNVDPPDQENSGQAILPQQGIPPELSRSNSWPSVASSSSPAPATPRRENNENDDDDDGIRTDVGTAGRHRRRRTQLPKRVNTVRKSLHRLRRASAGSGRLRASTVPSSSRRKPGLKRISTGGSQSASTPDPSSTLSPPPSHRSTKSTGSGALSAVRPRVDHFRTLVTRRLVRAGLLKEQAEDSPRAALNFSSDRENEDDIDRHELEEDARKQSDKTLQGWQISIPREETKEPEGTMMRDNEISSTPLRPVKEGLMASPLLVAVPSPAVAPPPLEQTSVTKPLSTSSTATMSNSVPKPSMMRRVSSISSFSSGKMMGGSAHDSENGHVEDDTAYLLTGRDDFGWGAEDYAAEGDDEDLKFWMEMQREILQDVRFSDLSSNLQKIHRLMAEYAHLFPKTSERVADKDGTDAVMPEYPVQVRMHNVSYQVKQRMTGESSKIPTVFNTSLLYPVIKTWKRVRKEGFSAAWTKLWEKPVYEMVDILDDISLVLHPGRSYLVLGPPASGKTSLLKVIAGRLRPEIRQQWKSVAEGSPISTRMQTSTHGRFVAPEEWEIPDKHCTVLRGRIQYNGRAIPEGGDEFFIENAMVYIDQLDQHAPRLTVDETFEFAFQCKTGGNAFRDFLVTDPDAQTAVRKAQEERFRVNLVLQALGLAHVRDTYVGDQSVRGISGGQRRRVTVGEMIMDRSPVLLGDEISTGLDAASTYDMIETLLHFGRMSNSTRVISLLQPSPETVSLFDEIILLGEGRIIYTGPMEEVEGYFADLGYKSPEFMDVADFLQQVSTDEGALLYAPSDPIKQIRPKAPTIPELADIFRDSRFGQRIVDDLHEPHYLVWRSSDEGSTHGSRVSGITQTDTVTKKYANGFLDSTSLICQRFLLLWTRDLRVIIAGAVKNILMGVSVGGVFASTTDEISIMGALFQAGLFIMLSATQSASSMVSDRNIYYKHADSNFYSAWPFVAGRTLSVMPQAISDVILFGTILYYMVGLAGREDAGNFFMFLSILITFSLVMQQQLAVIAAISSPSGLQIYSSILLLFHILFGGFIVTPKAIPLYWRWMYVWNPFSWAYRALVINEFRSSRWPDPEESLERVGFGGESEQYWVAYGFVYLGFYFLECCLLTALGLSAVRQRKTSRLEPDQHRPSNLNEEARPQISLPFKPVDLSFHDISYDVNASKGKDKLRLLSNVNGLFRAGRMTALMGSSGAGKSTLMDVIAGRKTSGTVYGEVRLNGFLKDPISFRRASGYVEQFDVQSPELTVRETVVFSAKLRIDRDLLQSEDDIHPFVDTVLNDVELFDLADALVGEDESGGLSFEQKKRLSIAVELAASPSIIFLDEPTSGLDARSALLVVKTLRRIASDGRTICATIHQPSSTVFDMFDDLLLLRKGGEVVYHGPTGNQSCEIVRYFESMGAPRIQLGENPANWMLRVLCDEKMGSLPERFRQSSLFLKSKQELDTIKQSEPDPSRMIQYDTQYATTRKERQFLVTGRVRSIYWRSPAYNLARLMVSGTIAFILGSMFLWSRFESRYDEKDMRARLSVVFISFIITGMLAIFGSIPVMTKLRDMFYRHRTSGMYGSSSIGLALGAAEKPFIVLATVIFTTIFLATSALMDRDKERVRKVVAFWGFFTFNFAIYSYFGQAFVCLVKPTATALILSSVFIGLNNFFSGLIVRPQFMVGTFFAVPYYICPGHYVYEGLVTSLYFEDVRQVQADVGSEFWAFLVDRGDCTIEDTDCSGTVEDFIKVFFDGEFSDHNMTRNCLILGFVLLLTRSLTWLSLEFIRFSD